jgi:gas vesicle protein
MMIKQFIGLVIMACIISNCIVWADETISSIEIYDNDYQPGVGLFIGKVARVSGTVVIVHLNETSGYHVLQDMNVYRGDAILTGRSASVVIRLNDGSQISQGASSRIQLNQMMYSPKKHTRNAFIHMTSGKARFSVQKLKSYKNKRFRVKTVSALIGVRGSDFMIEVQPELTQVAAFENTELALIGLDMPDLPPVILHSNEKSRIALGESPSSPVPLPIEEMDGLKNEFMLDRKAMTQTETKVQESKSEKKQTIRISKADAKKTLAKQMNVTSDALQPTLSEFSNDIQDFQDDTNHNIINIIEQKHEIATELPAFPVLP